MQRLNGGNIMSEESTRREEDARKVHELASEIALELGTALMKLLPELTAKYRINPQSFIVASVQAALKMAANGVASVTHMSRDELLALQRDLNESVCDAIRRNLPDLQEEHDRIWKVASEEGCQYRLDVDTAESRCRHQRSCEQSELNYPSAFAICNS
jgi:hypothetical protein